MAIVNLGSIKFNWKGAYAGGTAYAVDDVVSYNGSSYVCTAASTGNLPTDTNFWDQMSSAGTNGTDGTDLGTTLTTQGDIVYRDASGLARLPAGSANQVLQSGGAGANPSWTNQAEGGLVHLGTTDVTSAGGYVSFNNIFTTDYDVYRFQWSNFTNTVNGEKLISYLTDNSGSQLGAGQYETIHGLHYGNASTDSHGSGRDWGINYIVNTNTSLHTGVPCSGHIDIHNPRDSGNRCTWNGETFYHNGTYHYQQSYAGCLANTVEIFGMQFSVTGGSINTNSVFSVYGYKKS